ncbi:HAUS3 protein, partial [Urocolius indicus]|nr:HAUS3 protein [Urocolius indicus]
VSREAEFMSTLRLIYPHADAFCEQDFEWLFECPETKQFLEWFCSVVSKENVLSPAELEAYDALLASGKPILEGEALEKALQICQQVPQLSNMTVGDEGPSPEDLQQELKELQKLKKLQVWRHSKLQACITNLQQELSYVEEEEKVIREDLRKAQLDLEVEIFQSRAVLRQTSKAAEQLAEWCAASRPPALLCEMDLGPYLELEQQAAEETERLLQQVLPGSTQAPNAQGTTGSQGATERMDVKQTIMPKSLGLDGEELLKDPDSFWKELSRLEKARICAQGAIIVMSAEVEGNCAALEWAQRTLEALKENQHTVKEELRAQALMLQMQLRALQCDIRQTLKHQLPFLLRAEARQASLPILHRHFNLEASYLQLLTARLASQHSRLGLLELQLKKEEKELQQKASQLRKMETAMREAQRRLQEQRDYFRDASSSQKSYLCKWIDPKDLCAVRLWDMLMGQDRVKQPLRSYEAMAAKCSQLVQEERLLNAQLEAPLSHLPALESSTEVLYQQLYNSSSQLQLSSPQVTKLLQQLSTMHSNLCQKLEILLSDLRAKQRCLESPVLQTERNLYVYYYCNKEKLRDVVEELEKQVAASSK